MTSAVSPAQAFRLARRTRYVSRSLLQDLLPKVAQPEIVSFGLGLPAPELFPSQNFQRPVLMYS